MNEIMTPAPITTASDFLLEQEITMRVNIIKGHFYDLSLLDYHPEYAGEIFNEKNIHEDIEYQIKRLDTLLEEYKRRLIP